MCTRGFSLVELSIVLVILGLLTGGILAGQSLIRAAELRSYITDVQRYPAAVNAFKDKYFAYPGDMANATKFWGALGGDGTGNDAACQALSASGLPTCNAATVMDASPLVTSWAMRCYASGSIWRLPA